MSTVDTARQQLEAALARLESGLGALADRAARISADGEADSGRLGEELAALRAEHEKLAAEFAALRSQRDTQKQINRSVVDALDNAIGRIDTILAE
jgi:predicted  nucleic acid-binding Zn-ribbon protein